MEPDNVEPNKKEHSSLFEDAVETRTAVPVVQQLTVVAILLLAIFGTGYVPKLLTYLHNEESQSAQVPQASTGVRDSNDSVSTTQPFEDLSISARSAFVWDVNAQRILYEKDPDLQLPLASLTKLMTALVAHELVAADESVKIPLGAIMQDGESGLKPGEIFSLETLTDLTLMSSSNDGAFAIASTAGSVLDSTNPATAFVNAMNIRAEEIGLSQTYFRNPTGLDLTEEEAGAYGSARDMAFLMEYILKHQDHILERTTDISGAFYNEAGEYHQADNTNQFVNRIPGLIGSKTGYTTLAGGNLAVAFDASLNRPVIIVVLDSSYNGRFQDVLTLTEAVQTYVNQ